MGVEGDPKPNGWAVANPADKKVMPDLRKRSALWAAFLGAGNASNDWFEVKKLYIFSAFQRNSAHFSAF